MSDRLRLGILDANDGGHRGKYIDYARQVLDADVLVSLVPPGASGIATRWAWARAAWSLARRCDALLFTTGDPFLFLMPLLRLTGCRQVYIVHRESRFITGGQVWLRAWRSLARGTLLHVNAGLDPALARAFPHARRMVLTDPLSPAFLAMPPRRRGDASDERTIGVIGGSRESRCVDALVRAVEEMQRRRLGPRVVVQLLNVSGVDTLAAHPNVVCRRASLEADAAFAREVRGFDVYWAVRRESGSYFSSTVIEAMSVGVPAAIQANEWSADASRDCAACAAVDTNDIGTIADELSRLLGLSDTTLADLAASVRRVHAIGPFELTLRSALAPKQGN